MSGGTGERELALTPLRALNQRLKTIVEEKTAGKPVQVWGLVTDILRTHNGNFYLRLRQGRYGLRCYLPRELARELDFYLEESQTLRVLGEVKVYAPRCELELVAQRVDLLAPATEDEAWEALKRRAKAAGWLDPSRKRPLPCPPQQIGLVAGRRSKAREDVQGSLKDAGIDAPVRHQATWMAGEEAAAGMRSALEKLNARADVDVVVIARGGGGMDELAAFNDWELAQAIVESRVPVLTAIGHRQDRTLADLVADRSVPTPSLVGAALAGKREQRQDVIDELSQEQPDQRHDLLIPIVAGVLLVVLALLARALGWW